jgi:hypothetical protein
MQHLNFRVPNLVPLAVVDIKVSKAAHTRTSLARDSGSARSRARINFTTHGQVWLIGTRAESDPRAGLVRVWARYYYAREPSLRT